LNAKGGDRRSATLQREQRFLNSKMPASLSYHQALINGEHRGLAIINSDDLTKKTLCTMPGEKLPHGGIVEWMDNHWLITELDANNEVYSKGIMRQCNYQLRWIADDGSIVERWCIVEDGTKYLTGEYGDNHYILTRGDTRISVTLPKDKQTIKLNRKYRFLIDSFDSPTVLAYELTKPFKLSGSDGDGGILTFVMQECNTEDTDNFELHIANYYDHFPKTALTPNDTKENSTNDGRDSSEVKRWF
jgi:hypothetical protein